MNVTTCVLVEMTVPPAAPVFCPSCGTFHRAGAVASKPSDWRLGRSTLGAAVASDEAADPAREKGEN